VNTAAFDMPLELLRDPEAIDAEAAEPETATRTLMRLVGLTLAGFAAHAFVIGIMHAANGEPDAVQRGVAWFGATSVGFFAAICAGLPSYWFYGVVARIPAPAWRLAVELVRVQAVGAVLLAAVLPFWLAIHLWLVIQTGGPIEDGLWTFFSYTLPFLAAMPGVAGLRAVFVRMRSAAGRDGALAPLLLTAWWVVLFLYTAVPTITRLFVLWT
jgi:hypothetical protein